MPQTRAQARAGTNEESKSVPSSTNKPKTSRTSTRNEDMIGPTRPPMMRSLLIKQSSRTLRRPLPTTYLHPRPTPSLLISTSYLEVGAQFPERSAPSLLHPSGRQSSLTTFEHRRTRIGGLDLDESKRKSCVQWGTFDRLGGGRKIYRQLDIPLEIAASLRLRDYCSGMQG